MQNFIEYIAGSNQIKILIIVIVLDTILGILRAIREKELNSTIGIDGIIRKVAMIVTTMFLVLIDIIININLVGFIPESIRTALNFENVGVTELFTLLYIIFEILSIFKNAILCKLPIPKKLQNYLEKIMKEFTEEIKE